KPTVDNLFTAINALKNPPKIAAGNIKNKANPAALKQPNNANANVNIPKQIVDPEAKELIQKY
ncbi:hypothetical protein, partial [Escherichia coli]|uniref:hypothetical protein n=1 Tax=Escherichia coli TaxID=562 RepID=UPI000A6754A3